MLALYPFKGLAVLCRVDGRDLVRVENDCWNGEATTRTAADLVRPFPLDGVIRVEIEPVRRRHTVAVGVQVVHERLTSGRADLPTEAKGGIDIAFLHWTPVLLALHE